MTVQVIDNIPSPIPESPQTPQTPIPDRVGWTGRSQSVMLRDSPRKKEKKTKETFSQRREQSLKISHPYFKDIKLLSKQLMGKINQEITDLKARGELSDKEFAVKISEESVAITLAAITSFLIHPVGHLESFLGGHIGSQATHSLLEKIFKGESLKYDKNKYENNLIRMLCLFLFKEYLQKDRENLPTETKKLDDLINKLQKFFISITSDTISEEGDLADKILKDLFKDEVISIKKQYDPEYQMKKIQSLEEDVKSEDKKIKDLQKILDVSGRAKKPKKRRSSKAKKAKKTFKKSKKSKAKKTTKKKSK